MARDFFWKQELIDRLEKEHGYHYNEIDSHEGWIVCDTEPFGCGFRPHFDSWVDVEDWLNNVIVD